ncbi:hypothetical protein CFC21_054533 [Triticum aestivum]|uniref:Ribosome-binding factor A n=3 Tax=Triticum TaxID=4564 RepID=A0A9R0SNE3_TRITD|nr:probable ribosome-binding factor A, chloroplastic [Triticum dicoccoides]XP_044365939.1 probable ribosome-binding factor A, chloroplastic [Triticum aestivum]KAF7045424.1 hypothetical protein CFC21_054533 [Triticum aestivum]VAH98524.1 unnamed protein product [Triticum turgidum subsp. durum]
MFPCRPLVSPPLPRALAAAAPVSVRRRLPWSPSTSTSLRVVRCMAKERRVRMVAKQIQRELADMLTRDPVMQRAVLPEAALGADRYLSSLTTIADVELSNDLQVCKVYVSVFGDERGKKVAMAGLKDKTKYVRSQIGKRMKLRLTPEIRFIEDESMERGSRILTILDKLKEEREQREGNAEDEDGEVSDIAEEEDGDWEGDEPDEEDIIYVK